MDRLTLALERVLSHYILTNSAEQPGDGQILIEVLDGDKRQSPLGALVVRLAPRVASVPGGGV